MAFGIVIGVSVLADSRRLGGGDKQRKIQVLGGRYSSCV